MGCHYGTSLDTSLMKYIRRTITNILNRLIENGRMIKTAYGNYEKAMKTV
jgi:hypothetical protein